MQQQQAFCTLSPLWAQDVSFSVFLHEASLPTLNKQELANDYSVWLVFFLILRE